MLWAVAVVFGQKCVDGMIAYERNESIVKETPRMVWRGAVAGLGKRISQSRTAWKEGIFLDVENGDIGMPIRYMPDDVHKARAFNSLAEGLRWDVELVSPRCGQTRPGPFRHACRHDV